MQEGGRFHGKLGHLGAGGVGSAQDAAAGDAGGSVSVVEGVVAVTLASPDHRWDVVAGQRLAPRTPGATPRPLTAEERARVEVLLSDGERGVAAGGPPSMADAGVDPAVAAREEADAPPARPADSAPVADATAARPAGPSVRDAARQALAAGNPGEAIAVLEPQAAAGRLDRDGLELLADAYAAAGRLGEAVAAYREVAARAPNTGTAENALYAAARLLLDRAGQPREALEMFETLRRDYPDGAIVQEVAIARFETLLRLRDPRGLAALEEYLERFPSGYRAAEASFLLAAQLQAAGDCTRAIPLLRRYLELRPGGSKATDVRERLVLCGAGPADPSAETAP